MKFKHLGLALVVLPLAMALGVQGTVNVARADSPPPNCIRVLASFFGPLDSEDGKGLKFELEQTRFVAGLFGIPTGEVISKLAHKTGDVNQCLALLGAGGGS